MIKIHECRNTKKGEIKFPSTGKFDAHKRKKERKHDVDIESIVVVDFRPILYNSGEREK
jgi:hypothetical protein